MKGYKNKVTTFFLQQEVWLFLATILLFSYAFMQMGHQLVWRHFLGILLGLMLFFLPLLLWVSLRQQAWLPATTKRVSWATVFVLIPAVFTLAWPCYLTDLPAITEDLAFTAKVNRFGLLFLWITLLVLEGLLQWSQRRKTVRTANWLLSWNIPRLAIAIVAVFALSIVLANNYFHAYTREFSTAQVLLYYLAAVLQTFLIYISYYPIYYVHHHFLFNKLLRKKGLLYYLLGATGFLLLFVPLQNQVISLFPVVTQIKVHPLGLVPQVFSDLSFTLAIAFFFLSLPFIIMVEWYRQANAISTLEQEKTVTELQLLKQQINPHFFFNTLNNLYAMSLTQEKETPETILQLSELMRYVIYKGQEEVVPLKLELKYLQDYLDLQKLRLHKHLDLQFTTDIADEDVLIPPLLFIILVENAFKHGIEPAGGVPFLHLHLSQKGKTIHFRCHNSQEKDSHAIESGGLGLPNLRRRLSVLFPDQHRLQLLSSDHDYLAELSLEL
jgi:hypothetical protein